MIKESEIQQIREELQEQINGVSDKLSRDEIQNIKDFMIKNMNINDLLDEI